MCGRITLTHKIEEIYRRYNVEIPDDYWEIPGSTDSAKTSSNSIRPRYNIAPSQDIFCILGDSEQRDVRFMKWGLVPFWAKDTNTGYKMINARSETISSKPAFRNSFKRKRCLIPVSGFFEWKKTENKNLKQPYYFRYKNDELMSLAGIWESWTKDGVNHLFTCSIVTTSPNEMMKNIHDRMAVILKKENESIWLNTDSDKADLNNLMKPYIGDNIEYYPVTTLCNSPSFDNPECIIPEKTLI